MFPNGYNMPIYPSFNAPNMGLGMGIRSLPRTGGLFSRLGLGNTMGGISSIPRGINWQGLLGSASRALNVINQAIPVVKQVGPMYNNMKSMLKVASLFKDETDPTPRKINNNININNNTNNNDTSQTINEDKENTITTNSYSNSPNFFI